MDANTQPVSRSFAHALRSAVTDLYKTIGASCSLAAATMHWEVDDRAPDLERRLKSVQRGEISAEDISFLFANNCDSKGSVRYFIPRCLELLGQDASDLWVDSFVISQRVKAGEFETWADTEQQAVEAFFAALWQHRIESDHEWSLQVFDDFGWLVRDLDPFLHMLRDPTANNAQSCSRMVILLIEHANACARRERIAPDGRYSAGSTDYRRQLGLKPQHQEQLLAWLLAPALRGTLESLYIEDPEGDSAALLCDAADGLRVLGQSRCKD